MENGDYHIVIGFRAEDRTILLSMRRTSMILGGGLHMHGWQTLPLREEVLRHSKSPLKTTALHAP